MLEEKKQAVSIGRKTQLVTLIPLLTGILLCSVITLLIVSEHCLNWQEDMKDHIIEKELAYMQRAAFSRSKTIEYKLSSIVLDLEVINNLREDSSITPTLGSVVAVNAYDTFDRSGPELNKDSIEFVDYFLQRAYHELDIELSQLGFYDSDEGLDYRYPLQDMSAIQTMTQCGDVSGFDLSCSQSYQDLGQFALFFEFEQYFLLRAGTSWVYTAFFPEEVLDSLMPDSDHYLFLLSQNQGEHVVAVDGSSIASFQSQDLSSVLFADNLELQTSGLEAALELIEEAGEGPFYTTSGLIEGQLVDFLVGCGRLRLDWTNSTNYSVFNIINKHTVLEDWSEQTDILGLILAAQSCVFLIFVMLATLCAWALSRMISRIVIIPLEEVTDYLQDTRPINAKRGPRNKEANQLFEQLELLTISMQFRDPHFLLNQQVYQRITNLREAATVFRGVSNKRMEAQCMNMIGNAYYELRQFVDAEDAYQDAYEITSLLKEDISLQVKEELDLDESLLIKLTDHEPWEIEQVLLAQFASKRIQQLCLAKLSYFRTGDLSPNSATELLGAVATLQQEALEMALVGRADVADVLKMLIDIAETQFLMKYDSSALDFLDIVADEISKIEEEARFFVDLDIGRLRRHGLVSARHFQNQFPTGHLSYETHVLSGLVEYRKGLIYKGRNNYRKACEHFSVAVYGGDYYDPDVRQHALAELHQILDKYMLTEAVPELGPAFASQRQDLTSVLFVFAYDLLESTQLTSDLVDTISNSMHVGNIGAITSFAEFAKMMEVVYRDNVHEDLQIFLRLAEGAASSSLNPLLYNVYDSIALAAPLFAEVVGAKHLIVFTGEGMEGIGSVRARGLKDVLKLMDSVVLFEGSSIEDPDLHRVFDKCDWCTCVPAEDGIDLAQVSKVLQDLTKENSLQVTKNRV